MTYNSALWVADVLGIPLVYELDKDLNPVKHYYLTSDEVVKAAIDKLLAQYKASEYQFNISCPVNFGIMLLWL